MLKPDLPFCRSTRAKARRYAPFSTIARDCASSLTTVARYYYLECKTLVGAQIRYAVHDRNSCPLAMLGFCTAAWKLAPSDNFIGWRPEIREKIVPLVIDNPCFLIVSWIEIPNLGSNILAILRRRLPADRTERYNSTPPLNVLEK